MVKKFILDEDRNPVPTEDTIAWALWYENANEQRLVAHTNVNEFVSVSTVFLGLNYQFGDGPPILFETRVYGGDEDGYQRRYATWEEAEAGHKEALATLFGIP